MEEFIIKSDRLLFRFTKESDLEYVIQAENSDENKQFIKQWSEKQHEDAIYDKNIYHMIIENCENNDYIGYAIIVDINNIYKNISLQRFVITQKGLGYGREAFRVLKDIVFDKLHAHRFNLVVRDYNVRARNLYKSEGFIEEGIMRECVTFEGEYKSVVMMSILEQEYQRKSK